MANAKDKKIILVVIVACLLALVVWFGDYLRAEPARIVRELLEKARKPRIVYETPKPTRLEACLKAGKEWRPGDDSGAGRGCWPMSEERARLNKAVAEVDQMVRQVRDGKAGSIKTLDEAEKICADAGGGFSCGITACICSPKAVDAFKPCAVAEDCSTGKCGYKAGEKYDGTKKGYCAQAFNIVGGPSCYERGKLVSCYEAD